MKIVDHFNNFLAGELADWLSTMSMFYGVRMNKERFINTVC